jgi:hypothetical protein
MKFVEEGFGFKLALSLHGLRHHARGSFGDRAARTFKADIFYLIVFDLKIDVQLIAAERVESLRAAIRIFEFTKIARLLVVIEDYFLVKVR